MLLNTITAEELLEVVQGIIDEHGKDMPILFTADYGDIGHTAQALPIEGVADPVTITESGYSNSRFEIIESDGDEDEDFNESYIVIR